MPAVASRGVTLEEFLDMEDPDQRLELLDGEVFEMTIPKSQHGIICGRLARYIGNFVDDHNLGWTTSNDSSVIIRGPKDSLIGPDVGFWCLERNPEIPEHYFENVPDLAVEVRSPSDRRGMMMKKVRKYVDAGVRLVWLVDPKARTVTVYAGTMDGVVLRDGDTLDGGDVLQRFHRAVHDLL